MWFGIAGVIYHVNRVSRRHIASGQRSVGKALTAVQRNPGNYQQRLEASKARPLPSSSRTSGTVDTLPHLQISEIASVTSAVARHRVRIGQPGVGFCSEANVVATKWRQIMTATATKLGTNSVCNV